MEISGKILDTTSQPLYLANITITNGSQANKFGAVANESGNFDLKNDLITGDSEFRISYQGFKPQFFKTSELQGKTIKLEEDTISLDEVIVRPQDKPTTTSVASSQSNVKQYFQKHKLVFAGLGGLVGLLLLLTSIKKIK
jgi:sensor c-di-GMP phosphodiesterase-like protein